MRSTCSVSLSFLLWVLKQTLRQNTNTSIKLNIRVRHVVLNLYVCSQRALQLLCVTVPPKISPFAFQMDLHLGSRAGVQCLVTNGDLPLTIEWRKDGGPVDSDVSLQQLGEFTSLLSIDSLRPHHAGNYTCLATNSAAQASHSSRLLVNGNQPITSSSCSKFPIFSFSSFPPSAGRCGPAVRNWHRIFKPRSLLPVPPRIGPFTFGELIEGVRTQVQCVIQAGDPPLKLRWLKDGVSLPLELGIQVMQDDFSSTLAIPRVSRAHAGNYTCIAGNTAKSASVTAQLVVSGNVTKQT